MGLTLGEGKTNKQRGHEKLEAKLCLASRGFEDFQVPGADGKRSKKLVLGERVEFDLMRKKILRKPAKIPRV